MNTTNKPKYHRHLDVIPKADIAYIQRKDAQYDASWKKRDGAAAFFTIARPWDRFESISKAVGYDLFAKISEERLQEEDGTLIACVRDLRRYMMLLKPN